MKYFSDLRSSAYIIAIEVSEYLLKQSLFEDFSETQTTFNDLLGELKNRIFQEEQSSRILEQDESESLRGMVVGLSQKVLESENRVAPLELFFQTVAGKASGGQVTDSRDCSL